jgi:DNA-binding transcriptional MerR regulator
LGKSGDLAYHQEHVDRLRFIGRALDHGLSEAAIRQLLDANALLTCNDVFGIALRQLEERRQSEGPDDPAALALEKLMAAYPRAGGRSECSLLAAFAEPTTTQEFHFRAIAMTLRNDNGSSTLGTTRISQKTRARRGLARDLPAMARKTGNLIHS